MSSDLLIGILGLVATIVFGVVGTRYIVKKRSMKQTVNHGSIGIQSGRDTKINE